MTDAGRDWLGRKAAWLPKKAGGVVAAVESAAAREQALLGLCPLHNGVGCRHRGIEIDHRGRHHQGGS